PGIDLPQMIAAALDESEFLILLASPAAAASVWVCDELYQWCRQPQRLRNLIIVLTEGAIVIDESSKTIEWSKTTALPAILGQFLTKVPYYVDCSQLNVPLRQTLLDPDFKRSVNSIVAALRNIDPIEMSGQEIIQHRKNIQSRRLLVASAVLMLV